MREHMESNRALWDEWAEVHAASEFYDLPGFISGERGNRLRDYEMDALGDVTGKDLLHIQCHIGTDTLSWARLGAHVTGSDFSEASLEKARWIAAEIGVDARFVASNTYDLPSVLDGDFDIVYMSRGVLGWLPDLAELGRIVAHLLRPGGTYFLSEIHPVAQVFDESVPDDLRLRWPYWGRGEALTFPVQGSYADPGAQIVSKHEHFWPHSMGEIVTAFASAGLRIESLTEHPFSEWPIEFLEERADRKWYLPERYEGEIPLFFSLVASKP